VRVVVLASGRGTNFAALFDAQQAGKLPIELCALLSDKADARATRIAREAGVAAIALDPKKYTSRSAFDQALFDAADEFRPDLIVLAGFMRVIDSGVVEAWRGRIINIHPSLLPKYSGLRTHQRALDAGDAMHGASVHFVTPELDGGPAISQVVIEVRAGDDAVTLATRLLRHEHRLLVATVDLIARKRIALADDGIVFDGKLLGHPLQLADDNRLQEI
jgi:phosphoribosylglycinamide formyltransferase-1